MHQFNLREMTCANRRAEPFSAGWNEAWWYDELLPPPSVVPLPQGDGFKRQITSAGSYRHAFACHFPPGRKLRERKTTLRS